MELEYSRKIKSGGEPAEVTGVSRSGRVRKKSSKLADFESPDEIDTRFKRKTDRLQKTIKIVKDIGSFDESDPEVEDDLVMDIKDEALEVEDWSVGEEGDEDMGEEGDIDGEDANDPLQVDEDSNDTQHRETSNYSQAKSLYLSEKQGKKSVVIKDGQVVQRKKAQRKDKGKSRFTAYMLWAREVRPGIIESNPSMDFSAVNKRLGELWALVPTSQKYNWKRRAKRLAAKGNQKGMISTGKAAKQSNASAKSNLINKGGVKPQQLVRASKTDEQPAVTPPVVQKVLVQTPSVEKVEARKDNGEWKPSTLNQSDIALLDKIFLRPTKGQVMSPHFNLSSSINKSFIEERKELMRLKIANERSQHKIYSKLLKQLEQKEKEHNKKMQILNIEEEYWQEKYRRLMQ
ncbi:uncharacterized protein LOC143023059 isoform X3 [Oratosquilla oratoria]|uniref:uncharacterized protein LOC143023059 isoform X3 n=1 Tax=Oratosquilla oratoria TaxID=337810 RepID=UPI003F75EC8F